MQLLLGHARVMWVDASCRPLRTQASWVHKNPLRRMSPSPHGLSRDLCFIVVVLGIFERHSAVVVVVKRELCWNPCVRAVQTRGFGEGEPENLSKIHWDQCY